MSQFFGESIPSQRKFIDAKILLFYHSFFRIYVNIYAIYPISEYLCLIMQLHRELYMKTFPHFSHVNVKQIIKCSDTTGKMMRFPVKDFFSKHEKNLLNNSPKKRFISSALKLHFYQNVFFAKCCIRYLHTLLKKRVKCRQVMQFHISKAFLMLPLLTI